VGGVTSVDYGHVMSESGLAKRESRGVLWAHSAAHSGERGGEVWLGRGSEYGGCGDVDGDQARPELSGLVVGFVQ